MKYSNTAYIVYVKIKPLNQVVVQRINYDYIKINLFILKKIAKKEGLFT